MAEQVKTSEDEDFSTASASRGIPRDRNIKKKIQSITGARARDTLSQASRNSKPKNTRDAYEPREKEYLNWANRKGYPPVITPDKALLFMMEEVVEEYTVNGEIRLKGRENKRKRGATIKAPTIKMYMYVLCSIFVCYSSYTCCYRATLTSL